MRTTLHAGSSWYLGGAFRRLSQRRAPNVFAIDPTGAPAGCALDQGFDGDVLAIVQAGSAIFAGGTFQHYKGAPANAIAKIDPTTCALDTTFSPSANNGFDGFVAALTTDGTSLYVGGGFAKYRNVAQASNLAKLNTTTGALDTAFNQPVNGTDNTVHALAIAGSSLYVGGSFASYRGVPNAARGLAKVSLANGSIDTTFSPAGATTNGFNGIVYALVSTGTSLYVGGQFSNYKNVASSARNLAKLDLTSGAIDTTFSPAGGNTNGFDDRVNALATSGTSLYVAGNFTAYKNVGASALRLAKLDLTNGAIDTTFSTPGGLSNGFDAEARTVAVSGSSVYVGGSFTAYKGITAASHRIAKLDAASGAIDSSFRAPGDTVGGFAGGNSPSVGSLAFAGTTLWVGGSFTVYGGQALNAIAKINDATYALDTTFSPPGITANGFGPTPNVLALAASATSLYVGGQFTTYRDISNAARGLAKLDLTTGAIDTTFSPVGTSANGVDNYVTSLALSGTSVYVGGNFSQYRGVVSSANCLAKLDATTGVLDTTFSPQGPSSNGFPATVQTLAVGNGALYVGGAFVTYRGTTLPAKRLAKLDLTSGALDTTFSPATVNGFDDSVQSLIVAGTSVYAGGAFNAYRNVVSSANHIAKLDATTGAIDTTFSPPGATANGFSFDVPAMLFTPSALYAGGSFTTYRSTPSIFGFAKLDPASGALDASFSPSSANGFDGAVLSMAQYGNTLLVGGAFNAYRGAVGRTGNVALVDATNGALK